MISRYLADKDKRILTSAETSMKDAKSLIQNAHLKSGYLHGYVFYWQASDIVPFDVQEEIKEKTRLKTALPVFDSCEIGNLNVLETIQSSVLEGR
jgi:hypothetical protein